MSLVERRGKKHSRHDEGNVEDANQTDLMLSESGAW